MDRGQGCAKELLVELTAKVLTLSASMLCALPVQVFMARYLRRHVTWCYAV